MWMGMRMMGMGMGEEGSLEVSLVVMFPLFVVFRVYSTVLIVMHWFCFLRLFDVLPLICFLIGDFDVV